MNTDKIRTRSEREIISAQDALSRYTKLLTVNPLTALAEADDAIRDAAQLEANGLIITWLDNDKDADWIIGKLNKMVIQRARLNTNYGSVTKALYERALTEYLAEALDDINP